jgi:hypothetical protein
MSAVAASSVRTCVSNHCTQADEGDYSAHRNVRTATPDLGVRNCASRVVFMHAHTRSSHHEAPTTKHASGLIVLEQANRVDDEIA